jgi:hypothetical protein
MQQYNVRILQPVFLETLLFATLNWRQSRENFCYAHDAAHSFQICYIFL